MNGSCQIGMAMPGDHDVRHSCSAAWSPGGANPSMRRIKQIAAAVLTPAAALGIALSASSGAASAAIAGSAQASGRHKPIRWEHTASARLDRRAMYFALTQVGVPYVYGGEQPGKGFDCSGLVQWSYRRAGKSIPRTVALQWLHAGKHVSRGGIRLGTILFFYGPPPSHVALYVGHGKEIEAPHTGTRVRVIPVPWGQLVGQIRVSA